jgi:S-DNA-T family DNA segregation ATPase FtsK/SpoIIIE
MLFAPIGSGKPLRVQGCFVSDDEVLKVTTYVKEKSTANYDQEVLADIEKKAQQTGKKSAASTLDAEPNADELAGDELLPQAVEIVLETGQASVSMLQRRLKLGYARAARIVDEMEEKGIVGPHQGAKPRDILITKEQWEEMQSFTDTQMTLDDMEEPFTHAPEDF